jgi:hypothetical protein
VRHPSTFRVVGQCPANRKRKSDGLAFWRNFDQISPRQLTVSPQRHMFKATFLA